MTFINHFDGIICTTEIGIHVVGTDSEFYPGIFCHGYKFCRRDFEPVVYFYCYMMVFCSFDYTIHPFLGPERVISVCHLCGQISRINIHVYWFGTCLLYTSDAADEEDSVDL